MEKDSLLAKLERLKENSQAIERPWGMMSFKENIKEIAILSCRENRPVKTETNFHGKYVLIPAKSNIIDAELSLVSDLFQSFLICLTNIRTCSTLIINYGSVLFIRRSLKNDRCTTGKNKPCII